jgi:hypothetical protein
MILHFSHIGFTDGRTFTLASLSLSVSLMSSFGSALATASGRRYQAKDALQRKWQRSRANERY